MTNDVSWLLRIFAFLLIYKIIVFNIFDPQQPRIIWSRTHLRIACILKWYVGGKMLGLHKVVSTLLGISTAQLEIFAIPFFILLQNNQRNKMTS